MGNAELIGSRCAEMYYMIDGTKQVFSQEVTNMT